MREQGGAVILKNKSVSLLVIGTMLLELGSTKTLTEPTATILFLFLLTNVLILNCFGLKRLLNALNVNVKINVRVQAL